MGDHLQIMTCTCMNEYQDQKYGKGKRVHNQTQQTKPLAARSWRCTVCLKEK